MSERETNEIVSSTAPEPVGPYPHARVAGSLLFLSGIGPRVRGSAKVPGVTLDAGGDVVSYDFESQCHAVFANVRTILEEAGAAWTDIVDITAFLTDIKNDFATFNRIYAEYFPSDRPPLRPRPTRTTVEVSRLPTPIAVELKVIALAPGH
jgi:reactive intermediate/imine deaminase